MEIALVFASALSRDDLRALAESLSEALLSPGDFSALEKDYSLAGEEFPFAFVRSDRSGEQTQLLLLQPQLVSLRSFDYPGWSLALGAAIRRIGPVVSWCQERGTNFESIGLSFNDKFIRDAGWEGYSPADVFDVESSYFPRAVADSGAFWRNQSWWFREAPKGAGSFFQRLYLTATLGDVAEDGVLPHISEIEHRQQIMGDSLAGILSSDGSNRIKPLLDQMHMWNKELLSSLLNSRMLQRIGMAGGK